MQPIQPGMAVTVRTAEGETLPKLALTAPMMGDDFAVVWVARPEEWDAAQSEGREPQGIPWPVDEVRPS